MTWLIWRQHRKQVLVTAIALVVLAAVMIPTGLMMRNAFADRGLADCIATLKGSKGDGSGEACARALNQFSNQYRGWNTVGILFLAIPLLVGLFWGAPLVAREVEQGTHRLIWTQGISRQRWAVAKMGFVGAAVTVMAVVYGLGMSWWVSPLVRTGESSRFTTFFFDMQGVVPIGYTLFAVALGVFAGARWSKVLPAMAVTLGGFVGLRVILATLARPRYLPAEVRTYPVQGGISQTGQFDGDWVRDRAVRAADGKIVAAHAEMLQQCQVCPDQASGGDYNWVLYQPANRYWLFQTIETGIFVAAAVLLLGFALRRIRRIS